MTNTARKSALEAQLSNIAGVPVEITVRGEREFTLSAEGNTLAAFEPVKAFLSLTGQIANWSARFAEDCDQTCAYFTVAA